MLKRYFAVLLTALMVAVGVATPAHATGYDYSVSVTASSSAATVPTVVTWTITVSSVGDAMGIDGEQDGYVEFDVPSNYVSLVVTSECGVSNSYHVFCHWYAQDSTPTVFHVSGLLGLLSIGTLTVTPTITSSDPYTDVNASNDAATASCTLVTSVIVLC